MASVNKKSLREEFDTLKAQFERLSAEGKMAAESRALFQAMLMLFEVLMAVFMEKRTQKTVLTPANRPLKHPRTIPQSPVRAPMARARRRTMCAPPTPGR